MTEQLRFHLDCCPCGSGRLLKECCLSTALVLPSPPQTGFHHPRCYARGSGDCSKRMSRELLPAGAPVERAASVRLILEDPLDREWIPAPALLRPDPGLVELTGHGGDAAGDEVAVDAVQGDEMGDGAWAWVARAPWGEEWSDVHSVIADAGASFDLSRLRLCAIKAALASLEADWPGSKTIELVCDDIEVTNILESGQLDSSGKAIHRDAVLWQEVWSLWTRDATTVRAQRNDVEIALLCAVAELAEELACAEVMELE